MDENDSVHSQVPGNGQFSSDRIHHITSGTGLEINFGSINGTDNNATRESIQLWKSIEITFSIEMC